MSALTDVFTAIANAIRSKKGVSTTYKPSEMASAISSISTGTDTSDATLNSGSKMLSGYTAYAKGTKYTGSLSHWDTNSTITLNPTNWGSGTSSYTITDQAIIGSLKFANRVYFAKANTSTSTTFSKISCSMNSGYSPTHIFTFTTNTAGAVLTECVYSTYAQPDSGYSNRVYYATSSSKITKGIENITEATYAGAILNVGFDGVGKFNVQTSHASAAGYVYVIAV